jgi:AraC family transcriptional regulator
MRVSPSIEWYRLGSRRVEPVPGMKIVATSAERWRGMRVDLGDVQQPGELPEGILKEASLVAHVDAARTEVWYGGKRLEGGCAVGDVCVLPARMPYAVRRHDAGRLVIATVGPHLIDELTGEDLKTSRVELTPVFAARDALMTNLLVALADEVLSESPAGPLYAESLGTALVAHVVRRHGVFAAAAPRRGSLAPSALRAVTEHIDARLGQPLSLRALAQVARMSPYQLMRRFRASTGMPPHQFVLRRRILRARALLERSKLTILEIALACGFASQSHFAAAFRKLTGVTPRRYRARD